MKRVVILGSTGSIGQSALRVVESLPEHLDVVGLAVRRDVDTLVRQARRFGVETVAVSDPRAAQRCSRHAPELNVLSGEEGLEALAALDDVDIVLCAVVGLAGLRPVVAALEHGRDVALATKEVLVSAGEVVTGLSREHGGRLLPVDSEHNAIFQCLDGHPAGVRRLLLTASGGPFSGRDEVDFDSVTVEEALDHPTWDMGRKVTIDSATLMNKGLEILEAHWLFGVPVDAIDVLVHPESIVHSLVEFMDGSTLGQLSVPDMRGPIQYAFTYPERVEGQLPRLNLAAVGSLTFSEPDLARFPCLGLARRAAERGGTLPAVMNAANEIAVRRFLDREIPFSGIWRVVEAVMQRHDSKESASLDAVLESDAWAREQAGRI